MRRVRNTSGRIRAIDGAAFRNFHDPTQETAMLRTLRHAAVALALVLPAGAYAQSESQLQRFPLNKPIPEPAVTVCVNPEVPIHVNTLLAEHKSDEATAAFVDAVSHGQCVNGQGIITYIRQVHRVDSEEGAVLTVYEATAGGAKFYVPMAGFLHEDMTV